MKRAAKVALFYRIKYGTAVVSALMGFIFMLTWNYVAMDLFAAPVLGMVGGLMKTTVKE